ncbi:hypothetical protein VNPA120661_43930 [Pseudomonas aeruginosa]|nr:hypothetical protein VNPA120661_43930 [Pseudomonas aeruginosa]
MREKCRRKALSGTVFGLFEDDRPLTDIKGMITIIVAMCDFRRKIGLKTWAQRQNAMTEYGFQTSR